MTIVSQLQILATKGEAVIAETVGGQQVEVVEFFDPDDLAQEGSGITVDMPVEIWEHAGSPTEITVSWSPGNLLEEYSL